MRPGFDERMAVLSPHLFDAVPLTRAADQAGVPLRTAQRWLASYLAGGAAALSSGGRSDRGGHRVPTQLRELVEGLALRRPPPRVAEMHRAVSAAAVDPTNPGTALPNEQTASLAGRTCLGCLWQNDPLFRIRYSY